MPEGVRRRPASVYLLAAALLFQGLSGLVGGTSLVMDPTGGVLHMPLSWLEGSSFKDYLIPGLILLTALGAFPLAALYGVCRRRRWAWRAASTVGVALVIWIGIEIHIIGYVSSPPLQLIYGSLGAGVLLLALLPSVRGHLKKNALSG